MMNVFKCEKCTLKYNKTDRQPLNLPCGHVFCKHCILYNLNLSTNRKASSERKTTEEFEIICPKDNLTFKGKPDLLILCHQIYSNLPEEEQISPTKIFNLCNKTDEIKKNFEKKTKLNKFFINKNYNSVSIIGNSNIVNLNMGPNPNIINCSNVNSNSTNSQTSNINSYLKKVGTENEKSIAQGNLADSLFYCKKHPKEKVDVYCITENEFYCSLCTKNHSNCLIIPLKDQINLNEIKQIIQKEDELIDQEINEISKKQSFIDEYYRNQLNEIDLNMKNLIDLIEKKREKLIEMVSFSRSEHFKTFEILVQKNKEKQVKISSVNSKFNYLHELLENKQYKDFFNLMTNLQSDINEYKKLDTKLEYLDNPYPYFMLNYSIEDIGQIKYFLSFKDVQKFNNTEEKKAMRSQTPLPRRNSDRGNKHKFEVNVTKIKILTTKPIILLQIIQI